MKKSKIIVPALGLLLLSTAASVSGSVAWFVANRTFDANVGNFAVVSTTGALECVFTPGVGTENTVTNNVADTSTLKVSDNSVLTHGSVDHKNKKAYYPTDEKATTFNAGYALTGTKGTLPTTDPVAAATGDTLGLLRGKNTSGDNIFTAFTWDMTFTFNTTNASDSFALFFDNEQSAVARESDDGSSNLDTYKGFRIAFMAVSGTTKNLVWADNANYDCQYMSGNPAAATNYAAADKDFINASTAAANIASVNESTGLADGTASATAEGYYNYLGTFTPSSRTMTFRCAAWYEGTDSNVVIGADMDIVSAHMYFATRRVA